MVVCLEGDANDLHYGPADATAIPSSLAPVKSRIVYLSRAGGLTQVVLEKRPLNGCSASS